MDVAIVGAGISGILSAYWLLRNKYTSSIVIYEKRSLNAIPRKHCSGIISRNTLLRIPYAYKFIENKYYKIKIYTMRNFEAELVFDKNSIYKINRVAHEEYLMSIIMGRGVEITLNTNIVDVKKVQDKILVKGFNLRDTKFDRVIIAEGHPPNLSRKLGLASQLDSFKSIQQEVYLGKKLDSEETEVLHVYLSQDRGEFAWFIPINESKILVGVVSKDNVFNKLSLAKKFFQKKLNTEIARVEDMYGGVVLRGYPIKLVRENILGIGDTVSMVKSLSGGGLYPISVVSKIYGENLHKLEVVNKKIKSIAKDLEKQYKLYNFITNILKLFRSTLPAKKTTIYIGDSYFYDHHEKILAKAFINIKLG
ncbi:MAG: NAD(P)/FAD-dependent oxidoreductase [Ignisphaera sp.]